MDYLEIVKKIYKEQAELENDSNIPYWECWYKGYDEKFHRYYIYNGKKKIERVKKSLKMFKKVCEDWASLLLNEKTSIAVNNQEMFDTICEKMSLKQKGNQTVEYGFALSRAALVLTINDVQVNINEKTKIGIVQQSPKAYLDLQLFNAKGIIPLSYRGNDIVECAFIEKGSKESVISIHELLDDGTYKITNLKVENKNQKIKEQIEFNTQCKTPLFMIVSPNIVNNLDVDSKKPISICANAIDICKHIDDIFDSYNNEFILGKKRTFISAKLNQVNTENGNVESSFDPNDQTVYVLPQVELPNGAEQQIIKNVSDSLRTNEHQIGLKDAFNLLSAQVGLGVDYYNFEKGRVMTATQVISEKSDTFRNLKKHELLIEKGLLNLAKSIMFIYNLVIKSNTFDDTESVAIQFDDSIIEDKATEKERDQKDVEFGAMSLLAYRMKWYGETEKEAKKAMKSYYGDADFLKRLSNFTPFLTQGVLTPLQFVKMVYIDIKGEKEQQALAEEIKESLKTGGDVFPEEELGSFYKPPVNEEQK